LLLTENILQPKMHKIAFGGRAPPEKLTAYRLPSCNKGNLLLRAGEGKGVDREKKEKGRGLEREEGEGEGSKWKRGK